MEINNKMKTVRNFIVVAFSLMTLTSMASPLLGVEVLTTSHEIFYFKIDKGWIGGEVDVLDENSKPISVQKLDKKKMLIDFFDIAPGTYTIVIKKGGACNCQEEFIYIKK